MVVMGAGGHAMETLDVLLRSGFHGDAIVFFDNTAGTKDLLFTRYRILKSESHLTEYFQQNNAFCLGVGAPDARAHLYQLAIKLGGQHSSITSRDALISEHVSSVEFADVFPAAIVGPNASLAAGVLINARASIHHEVSVGRFSAISPAASLLGGCSVGEFSFIGAGAVILPRIRIGNRVTIGAGSVITKDIEDNAVVMGVPGKIYKHNN